MSFAARGLQRSVVKKKTKQNRTCSSTLGLRAGHTQICIFKVISLLAVLEQYAWCWIGISLTI